MRDTLEASSTDNEIMWAVTACGVGLYKINGPRDLEFLHWWGHSLCREDTLVVLEPYDTGSIWTLAWP